MMRRSFSLMLLALGALTSGLISAWAANPVVVLPDGRRTEGTEVRATREGVIYLTTGAGRIEYPKGTKVIVDQPQDLKRAIELIRNKQYSEAAALLEKTMNDYRFLGWDMKAMKFLAQAYAGQGAVTKSIEIYERLMAEDKESANDGEVRSGYLSALAAAGNREKVTPLLAEAIATGSRPEAAQAQMIRARFRLEVGDIEGALYDFMRTARFFKEFKSVAPEAAFRTAEILEKLGDPEHAAVYYRQVAQEFPESPFAVQAKVKTGTKP